MVWTIRGGVSRVALAIGALAAEDWASGSVCSIEGEDGGAGGGAGGSDDAAAAAAAAVAAGGAAAALAGGGGGDEAAAAAAAAAGGGADPEWLASLSADGGDAENPSTRDWVKSKGIKTPDDLAKGYRELEKAHRASGKIVVPGEGAKPEEIAAFHKAIGVPEKVEGYTFETPEGAELDSDIVTPLREVALKAGVPAAGFKALAEGLVAVQLDQLEALKATEDADAAEWLKAQGAQKDAKLAAVTTAMRALELSAADVAAMQRGFGLQGKPGSAKVLGLLARLGDGMAEDALLGGDGKRRFGITGPEAQAEIDKLTVDTDFGAKLMAKDPAAVERWNRLNAAVAAHKEQEARKLAAA